MAALERDSKRDGTLGGELDFALLLDGLSAEREQGITIDVSHRYFSTARRHFIVADTPGHEQYTRNMVTGASTADCAVILLDARKGVLTQTRRHSWLVALLGIRHVVLAVNKMDLVEFAEERFREIEREYATVARQIELPDIQCIPVSALAGDNVVEASDSTPWYDGPTLLEYLETVEVDLERMEAAPVPDAGPAREPAELGLPRLRRHDRRRRRAARRRDPRAAARHPQHGRAHRHLRRRPRRGGGGPGGHADARRRDRRQPRRHARRRSRLRRASPTSSRRPSCGWPTTRCTAGATT